MIDFNHDHVGRLIEAGRKLHTLLGDEGRALDAAIVWALSDQLQEFVTEADGELRAGARDTAASMFNRQGPGRPPFADSRVSKTPANPASSTTAGSSKSAPGSGGHRHKFNKETGKCEAMNGGQPCTGVRQRSRNGVQPPAASAAPADRRTLPLVPPGETFTRHFRAVSAAGGRAYCGAELGALDALVGKVADVNCLDCKKALENRGGAL